jgi:hypothetical protein
MCLFHAKFSKQYSSAQSIHFHLGVLVLGSYKEFSYNTHTVFP